MEPKKEDIDILLITGGVPGNKSMATNTDKLLKILLNITDNLHLVTFCNNELISGLNNKNIHFLKWYKNRFKRFLYIYRQILVSKVIFSLHRTNNIKIVLFAFGQDIQILPMISAKIVAKKTIIRSDGRLTIAQKKYFKTLSVIERYFFKIIEEINYKLVNVILTECEYMISENNFQKYNSQVGNLFVDIDKFMIKTDIRKYEIGFVGRLSKEKGIVNFLKSLKILNGCHNVIIIGDGEEKNSVLNGIQRLKSIFKLDIKYIGWVENEKLPNYLNKIKILVVPSYKEGLPNIVLEAMACGCVVVATSVGGIPDIIKDGETGFIMENNSPECIAENVMRALEHPDLEGIVENARARVEREFTYEVAVERYRKILNNLGVESHG
jgi:glycosyltransferase involved in cell wall biosynthesis